MDTLFWSTDEPHHNNSQTMADYIENHNMLDIHFVDGTYAEGSNGNGERYEIHASGNGDSNNHKIEFVFMDQQ